MYSSSSWLSFLSAQSYVADYVLQAKLQSVYVPNFIWELSITIRTMSYKYDHVEKLNN